MESGKFCAAVDVKQEPLDHLEEEAKVKYEIQTPAPAAEFKSGKRALFRS